MPGFLDFSSGSRSDGAEEVPIQKTKAVSSAIEERVSWRAIRAKKVSLPILHGMYRWWWKRTSGALLPENFWLHRCIWGFDAPLAKIFCPQHRRDCGLRQLLLPQIQCPNTLVCPGTSELLRCAGASFDTEWSFSRRCSFSSTRIMRGLNYTRHYSAAALMCSPNGGGMWPTSFGSKQSMNALFPHRSPYQRPKLGKELVPCLWLLCSSIFTQPSSLAHNREGDGSQF